jgi:hypothetical protein
MIQINKTLYTLQRWTDYDCETGMTVEDNLAICLAENDDEAFKIFDNYIREDFYPDVKKAHKFQNDIFEPSKRPKWDGKYSSGGWVLRTNDNPRWLRMFKQRYCRILVGEEE